MIPTFLCSVAGGMSLVLGMGRIDLMSHKYVRFISALALALSAGTAAWCIVTPTSSATTWWTVATVASILCAVAAAAVVVLASWVDTRSALLRGMAVVGGICGCGAACVLAALFAETPASSLTMTLLNAVGQVLGSIVAGSVTVAWLLGHAYLTATRMTIAPLQRFSRIFSVAVMARCGYLAVCLVLMRFAPDLNTVGWGMSGLGGAWLILSLRIGVGLLAVGAFAYMIGDCVKVRSTQSATGILYFASLFAYVGELSSQHLVSEFGVPL